MSVALLQANRNDSRRKWGEQCILWRKKLYFEANRLQRLIQLNDNSLLEPRKTNSYGEPSRGIFVDCEPVGPNSIFFNVTRPPFDNKKVRQAIAYAVNKKEVVKAVYWGLGEALNNQAFNSGSRFYVPIEDREVNLLKAKQLLAEAGYGKGFKAEFLSRPVGYDLASCESVIGQLKEIGIEATMRPVDLAPLIPMLRKGEYGLAFFGETQKLDWDDAYYMRFHSGEIDKNNFSRYNNRELDALPEKGRTVMK